MSDPIAAVCRRDYTAVHTSGVRPLSSVRYIVLHDEEAADARSAAAWFQNPASGGSAHLCVDDKTCYRTLPNDAVAWGAPGANEHGFHIEQAGFARWSTVIWRRHYKTLQRAAFKTAVHLHLFKLPPVFLTAADLKAGRKGVTTHAECTKAFGGDHTDPGPGWPRPLFMALVRSYYKTMGPL